MQLPSQAIRELKRIHYQLSGEMLTDAEASSMGNDLFRLFLAVYEPIPKEWIEKHANPCPDIRQISNQTK